MQVHLGPRIIADPDILAGTPVIAGTEVPASVLVAAIAAGKTVSQVASEHGVSVEDVRAALEYAAQRAGEPVAASGAADDGSREGSGTPVGTSALADEEARRVGLDPTRLSSLGRRLLELRAQGIAAGEPPLASWEDLDAEIAERRGGGYLDLDA
jgi:uncharacterized protein (DUF433 family)